MRNRDFLDRFFPGEPEAPKREYKPEEHRCLSYRCHGQCGRRPTRGAEHSEAKDKRRARSRAAKASRKANR